MKKIVFDSDGLIKLTKAGCLQKVLKHFVCSITKEVYDESVIKGMERFYDDAFQIEEMVKKGMLKVENVKNNKHAGAILKGSAVGRGESSSLHLYFNVNALAIISDDRVFLDILQRNNVPFVTPTDLIVRLYELNIISKDETMNALNMIKPYISKNNYDKAKTNLEV